MRHSRDRPRIRGPPAAAAEKSVPPRGGLSRSRPVLRPDQPRRPGAGRGPLLRAGHPYRPREPRRRPPVRLLILGDADRAARALAPGYARASSARWRATATRRCSPRRITTPSRRSSATRPSSAARSTSIWTCSGTSSMCGPSRSRTPSSSTRTRSRHRRRELGFLAAYTEGAPQVLGGRSPNRLYLCMGMPTLLRNTHLSDEIAYRFGGTLADRHDPGETLDVRDYADEVAAIDDPVVSVFKDFETYGEHFGAETGILDFLRALPDALAERGVATTLPRRVIAEHPARRHPEHPRTDLVGRPGEGPLGLGRQHDAARRARGR